MIDYFADVPSPFSAAALEELGGAVSRVGKNETAFGDRSAPYSFIINFWEAMQPLASDAVYVNYLGSEEQDRVRAAYGTQKYERLVALKNKYDPTNLFRMNANVEPTV